MRGQRRSGSGSLIKTKYTPPPDPHNQARRGRFVQGTCCRPASAEGHPLRPAPPGSGDAAARPLRPRNDGAARAARPAGRHGGAGAIRSRCVALSRTQRPNNSASATLATRPLPPSLSTTHTQTTAHPQPPSPSQRGMRSRPPACCSSTRLSASPCWARQAGPRGSLSSSRPPTATSATRPPSCSSARPLAPPSPRPVTTRPPWASWPPPRARGWPTSGHTR